MPTVTAARRPTLLALLAVVVAVLIWSAIDPFKLTTWLMETIWPIIGLAVVLLTWRRFPLTTLLCVVLAAWALVLAYGGKYSYAHAPLGQWLSDVIGAERNSWDRVGHLMQGFAPAVLFYELLWRRSPLRGSRWLTPLVLSCCLALTVVWELLEWAGSIVTAGGDPAFLGGQGDVWDTQQDMLMCLVGAVVALVVLGPWHRRQLAIFANYRRAST